MALPDIFSEEVSRKIVDRLNNLTPESERLWGKMDVAKMLAHCNVAYEMIYEPGKHPKPNFFMQIILKLFVKRIVVGEKPYKKNNPTAPAFVIKSDKDFEKERTRLVEYVEKTQKLGRDHYEGLESNGFGKLTAEEVNNMMYKHLDHHLRQFGV